MMDFREEVNPGRLPYKKDRGARRKFWKEPLRATKILSVLWANGGDIFTLAS